MKEKRGITSVGFWLFIFTIAFSLLNLNNYVQNMFDDRLIFTGGYVLSFFMIIAGYYLMKEVKSQKEDDTTKTFVKSWKYTGSIFSKLYPAMLGGIVLTFIIRNIIFGTKIDSIISVFMSSIWEFIGLAQLNTTKIFLWNEPLWLISSIVVSSLILYYIASKSENFFVGIFAPLLIVVTYATAGISNTNWSNAILTNIGFSAGLSRTIAGMTVGMLLYYVVEYFRKKKFTENMTMIFSLLHIGIIMLYSYTLYNGIIWSELTNGLIMAIFCTVLLVDKDYISALYNNSKICSFLGRLSLYYFTCHMAFIYLMPWLFPEMPYHTVMIFNILFSSCWAFIMMYFDDYIITPLFRNKKEKKRKTSK